ncbi:MAG: porin [Proteobacteria bacterium]|nr:porin [Pseudomonadota bacterium]
MNRRQTITLALALLLAPTFVAAENTPNLEELWRIVQQQQRTIQTLTEKLDRALRALGRTETQLAGAQEQLTEHSERIEATAEVVDESRGVSQAASWTERTSIGGYGELHYNNLEDDSVSADGGADDLNRVDFHRFVLLVTHEFNDWLRFAAEVELEHALAGDGEPGEVELEQAWIEADLSDRHHLRAGLDILPIGLLNPTHEPNTFYGVERNRVESEIIPSTWWEAGLGLFGDLMPGLSYDLVIHSGLVMPTSGASAFRPRSGRLKVAEADDQDFAFTGRLRYTALPGLELALSGQYQADYSGTADDFDAAAFLVESHLDYRHASGLGLRALYARWELGDDSSSAVDPRTRDAETLSGWYVEPAYRFAIGRAPGELGIFGRYSRWDERDQLGLLFQEFERFDIGMNYWPHPDLVLKFDVQWEDVDDPVDRVLDGFNLGLGYRF